MAFWKRSFRRCRALSPPSTRTRTAKRRDARLWLLAAPFWRRPRRRSAAASHRAETREIVGVMPRGFRVVDRDFDVLTPFAFDRGHLKLAASAIQGLGRLRPGVTIREANADLSRMLPIWMDSFSNGPGTNPHFYETLANHAPLCIRSSRKWWATSSPCCGW